MILEAAAATFGLVGLVVGFAGWRLARQWQKDCQEARILIAVKGKVRLDAPLVEWLAWNKALPKREQGRGGVIFQHNGVRVALARPKVMAAGNLASSTSVTTRKREEAAA